MMTILVIFLLIALSQCLPQTSEDFIDPNYVGIVGGQEAETRSFPYQVAIFHYKIYLRGYEYMCGGSLISNSYVLTAAQCLLKFDIRHSRYYFIMSIKLLFGAHRIHRYNTEEDEGVIIDSSHFIIYPEYSAKQLRNDIALIRLENPVDETEDIQVIETAAKFDKYHNKFAIVAGWGLTNRIKIISGNEILPLYYIKNKIMSNEKCKAELSSYKQLVQKTTICLSSLEENSPKFHTIGRGDEGSPLVVDSVQVGIISWRPGGGNEPSISTRVSEYYKWIQEQIKK